MRRRTALFWVAALAAALWGSCAAWAVDKGSSSEAGFVPWVPTDSWPGGAQYDARLETSVQFWGAGVPLKQVFEGVREQTGVEIGFWPAGDDNERICVNLYLNPKKPPTLRELMAQLSWVLDCGFGLASERSAPGYWLLSTSARYGAEERLRAERRAVLDRIRERRHGREEQTSAKVAAKLAELTEALELPREEAIRRYRGADDLLLLALLEPGRRRVSEFVLGLSNENLVRLLEEGEIRLAWEELSFEQRSSLRQHFLSEASAAMEQGHGYVHADPLLGWDPSGEVPLTVVLTGARHGFFVIRGEFWSEEDQDEAGLVFAGQHLRLVSEVERPVESIALLQELGEEADSTTADVMYREGRGAYRAEHWQRLEQERREWVESHLSRSNIASSEVRNILTTFRFPGSRAGSYRLWEVQETVAAGTGLHVVSDCFSQPRRSVVPFLELLEADETLHMTGLLALKLWTVSAAAEGRFPRTGINDAEAGWEWEDAGEFLRFRHLARDVWRAAFLPEGRLREMDQWLSPYVTEAVESGRDEISVAVSVDIREASRIARQLNDLQLEHGGKISYGDPADVEEAYRQMLREKVWRAISRWAGPYSFLATFSEYQWERLCGPGLRWREDLTPDQQAGMVGRDPGPFGEQLKGCVMRLTEGGPMQVRGWGEILGVREKYVLEFVPREPALPGSQVTPERRGIPEVQLPRTIVIRLRRPEQCADPEHRQ